MKKAKVLHVSEVEVKPFRLEDLTSSREKKSIKISKKELKQLAKEIGLDQSDEVLITAKKLLEAYMVKRKEA